MSDYIVSQIRTWVPVAVGAVLTWATPILPWLRELGIDVSPDVLKVAVTTLVIGAYYTAARFLEARFPKLGWLLGSPKVPTYR